MTVRCGQILVASLLLFFGCADTPPAVIENKSVAAVDVPPEVRQTNTNRPDYGPQLAAGPDYVVEPGDTLYAVAFRLGMDYRKLASLNDIDPPYVIRVGQALKTAPDAAPAGASVALEAKGTQGSAQQRAGGTGEQSAVKSPLESSAGNATESATEGERIAAAAKPAGAKSEPGPPSHTLSTAKTLTPNAPVDRWAWPADGKVSRAFSAERHKGIDLVGERGSAVMATAAGVVVYAGAGVTGYGALLIVKHNDTYLSAYGHNDALLVAEGQRVDAGQVIARMGSTSSDSVKLHFEIRRNGRPVNPTSLLPQR
ncbi:MAG: peptidoglycan DD-metalloendopeptidase family protein [Luminiphilus sp.]